METQQKKKCQVNGHQNFFLSFICTAENCSKRRIACPKCIKESHSEHAASCVFFDEILSGSQNSSSISSASSELSEKVKQLKNIMEDTGSIEDKQVEEILDELETNLIKTIELERQNLKQNYQKRSKVLTKMIDDIIEKFKDVFLIDPIIKLIDEFSDGKQTSKEVSNSISEYLKNEIRQQKKSQLYSTYEQVKSKSQYFKNFQCLKEFPSINKTEIQYLQNQIKEECEKIGDLVRIPGNWYFLAPTIANYNNFINLKENATTVEFSSADAQQYVYGSQPMKYPYFYQWTIRLEGMSANNYNTIYAGVVLDTYKEDMNNMFAYGKCVYLDLNNNAMTQFLTLKPGKKMLGQVIKENAGKKKHTDIIFVWDSKNNLFAMQDSEQSSRYEYSKKQIKKFNNQNAYNKNQHMQFFKPGNLIRPFIMNYGSNFKAILM